MINKHVSLGLGAAWGFAGHDLTSPARAAAAGGLPDTLPAELDARWWATELRVHGVSGSDGPTMLEHPNAVQVAGDSVTMFYRRWTPAGEGGAAVPWKLEAYSWGGLTEAPLAAAAWILMAPFMLFNLCQFMLPRTVGRHAEGGADGTKRVSRDRWHSTAAALLRLLAASATIQFAVAVIAVLVNAVAYQGRQANGLAWLEAFARLPADVRMGIAALGVAAVIASLWCVSVATANKYEARISEADRTLNADCPLTQPSFWAGHELVRRQRSLHAAAALAMTSLVLARPERTIPWFRGVVLIASVAVLAAVVVSLVLPLADRHSVVLGQEARPAGQARSGGTSWCRAVLGVAIIALIAAAFTGGWQDPEHPVPRTVAGFTGACVGLLLAQGVLMGALLIVVGVCAHKARPGTPDRETDPYLRGHLTTLIATLGVCLGGLISALVVLFISQLLGTPVPSAPLPAPLPAHALEVPWPLYAFSAEPVGLLLAAICAGIWLVTGWRRNVRDLTATTGNPAQTDVERYYGVPNGNTEATGQDPERALFAQSRQRVAKAWATAGVTDRAAGVALILTVGMLIALVAAELIAWQSDPESKVLQKAAAVESVVGLILAGVLVGLLRSAYQDPSKRKTIGALWDVGTFWPRATHPFAPPCYAERAVPELVDRVRLLTGTVPDTARDDPAWWAIQAHLRNADRTKTLDVPAGPLLLTGYSQGSVIAPAVVAQLPTGTVSQVALLTLACPARRLYGRAFPAYFGPTELTALANRLTTPQPGAAPGPARPNARRLRWRNLVRQTDYIGSWVQRPATPDLTEGNLNSALDQPCWDPPELTADMDPTPAPIHRHSDFWQDPRTTELGEHLIGMLTPPPRPADAQTMPSAEPSRPDGSRSDVIDTISQQAKLAE